MLTLYLHQTDGFFLYLVASKQSTGAIAGQWLQR